MEYIKTFVVGSLICMVGQILIDRAKLTPARALAVFVTLGIVLTAVDLYRPLVQFAGARAIAPLSGFGCAMAKGAEGAMRERSLLGALMGDVTSNATGIAAAVFFGYLVALVIKPGDKS